FLSLSTHNALSTTVLYTLSLHDALPIFSPTPKVVVSSGIGNVCAPKIFILYESQSFGVGRNSRSNWNDFGFGKIPPNFHWTVSADRKSTRLNSSHVKISYAVFCLKKKKK